MRLVPNVISSRGIAGLWRAEQGTLKMKGAGREDRQGEDIKCSVWDVCTNSSSTYFWCSSKSISLSLVIKAFATPPRHWWLTPDSWESRQWESENNYTIRKAALLGKSRMYFWNLSIGLGLSLLFFFHFLFFFFFFLFFFFLECKAALGIPRWAFAFSIFFLHRWGTGCFSRPSFEGWKTPLPPRHENNFRGMVFASTPAAAATALQKKPCTDAWGLLRRAGIQLPSHRVTPEPGHTRDPVSRMPSLRPWRSSWLLCTARLDLNI